MNCSRCGAETNLGLVSAKDFVAGKLIAAMVRSVICTRCMTDPERYNRRQDDGAKGE